MGKKQPWFYSAVEMKDAHIATQCRSTGRHFTAATPAVLG